jgi:hypothetical protein
MSEALTACTQQMHTRLTGPQFQRLRLGDGRMRGERVEQGRTKRLQSLGAGRPLGMFDYDMRHCALLCYRLLL